MAANPGAASGETLLGSFNVPLDGSKVYSAPLVAGGVYRIAASGTYTQSGGGANPVTRDAIYCFDFAASPPAGCSPSNPVRIYLIIVRNEGNASLAADLEALNAATTLAYNSQHIYSETFTATTSTRLEMFFKYNSFYSYSGSGIRLDLYLVSLPPAPAPGGGGPPLPGGTPVTQVKRVYEPTKSWGELGSTTRLGPGDELLAPSPPIGRSQREASVTVSGDPTGKTAVAAKLTPKDCVRLFIVDKFKTVYKPVYTKGFQLEMQFVDELVEDDDEFILSLLGLLACLEELREANFAVPSATAARSRCGRSAARVKVRFNRASGRGSWTVRPSRRGPSKRLRVTCRLARDGTMTLRIRTASRRTTLRKVVGRRLAVGAYRARDASGTATIRTTFRR